MGEPLREDITEALPGLRGWCAAIQLDPVDQQSEGKRRHGQHPEDERQQKAPAFSCTDRDEALPAESASEEGPREQEEGRHRHGMNDEEYSVIELACRRGVMWPGAGGSYGLDVCRY